MRTHNLGYPRIGNQRELKKALESYWAGNISDSALFTIGKSIREQNWTLQNEAGIDMIPSNDFSFYDQVLDMSLALGAIPKRYHALVQGEEATLELYFAMARGYQKDHMDITAMEMTKWFDTNYHYIVPEFYADQEFTLFSTKIIDEFLEAKALGIISKPVLIGPVSYVCLGKEKEKGFDKMSLLDRLLPVYIEIIAALQAQGARCIQFDEPFLSMDINAKEKQAYTKVYQQLKAAFPNLEFLVATYFEGVTHSLDTIKTLPIDTLHIDVSRAPEQLALVLQELPKHMHLSLGVVDGRNVWKNNYQDSLAILNRATTERNIETISIAPSCSLLHVPCDLDLEPDSEHLIPEIKQWLSFAKQKLAEVVSLKKCITSPDALDSITHLAENTACLERKKTSQLIHNTLVEKRVQNLSDTDAQRNAVFAKRKVKQHEVLDLPLYPTTTIGSFPQTKEVRRQRFRFKKGEISLEAYTDFLKKETERTIRLQEDLGLDVLVHGEFERNDMVEYFGERLQGFGFTKFGWVQSYGSRCVKPPIIYGSVHRDAPMTVAWASYAQSLTSNWVKGMLTGPVTILQWSFVRNDQPRATTCNEIAFAIRDEVVALEKAGIKIIQIDEPAIREGLPLRKAKWNAYLDWAIKAFRVSASGVADTTQIHTHMCYSEFNDIIEYIGAMDADVITIECSRSQMELLDVFAAYQYPNEIGPGVYDIHSPRVPNTQEMVTLIQKARKYIPDDQLWVNPDCGLKTRHWPETEKALKAMVAAAHQLRAAVCAPA